MSEYVPTTEQVNAFKAAWHDADDDGQSGKRVEIALAKVLGPALAAARREGQAEGMRSTANWLEGGTPRAYGFQHPCDPPGTITNPSGNELRLLYAVDAIREAADRIENGADQ